jgi:ABC-type phosphate transport system permease subunit
MNEPPRMGPLPVNQRNVDLDHLNLLSIFHFISAGLALLGMLFLIVHYEFMHAIFTNPGLWNNGRQEPPPPAFIFTMMKIVYVFIGLMMVVILVLNVLSGLFLRERKNWTFSLAVACINCLQIPLGTTLGVFTIIVLSRQSVKDLYKRPG